MNFSTRASGEILLVEVDGNLKTPSDMEDFSGFIDKQLERNMRKFVLNFTKVTFINSSGLGRLILASKRINEKKGALGVVGLSNEVDELFTITRIKEKIPVFPDEETAIRAFS